MGVTPLFVLIFTQAQAQAAPGPPPPALAQYLAGRPPYHLLTATELARERDYVESHRLFSPFAITDLNGDGVDDVLAVLVRRDGAKTVFSVAAFHATGGSAAARLIWIIKDSADPILGVASSAERRVDVMKCYQCGANPFYRWNGVEYQANLRARGERVTVYHGATGAVAVHQEASSSGRAVATLPPCTHVQIVSLFPRDAGRVRFYEVAALLGDRGVTGFVSAEEVDEMPCVGR